MGFSLVCVWLLVLVGPCVGKSLLYLTMHGGKDGSVNLHAFDLSGNSVFEAPSNVDRAELRGMALVGNTLFVAQGYKDASEILAFGVCDPQASGRVAFSGGSLDHPYGLGQFGGSLLYSSNQDNNAVSKFNLTQGQEVRSPLPSVGGPRGLAVDEANGVVFVASKDANAVLGFSSVNGSLVASISKTDPIGVAVYNNLIIVSSGQTGFVEAFSLTSPYSRVWSSSQTLGHGAGIAVDASSNTVYVAEQTTSSVMAFDVRNGQYISTLLSGLSDVPEQIFIAEC